MAGARHSYRQHLRPQTVDLLQWIERQMSSSDDDPSDMPSRVLSPYKPPAPGNVRIGGRFELKFEGYAKAYFDAAGCLIDSTLDAPDRRHQLARPCIFLQRHALELLLKNVRDAADEIHEARAALTQLRPVEPTKPHKLIHDLVKLTDDAEAAATRAGYSLPSTVRELAASLAAFEGPDETVLRYARGKNRQRSFPDRVEAPIEDWQRRLGDVLTSIEYRFDATRADCPLLNEMSAELNGLCQELYAADLL